MTSQQHLITPPPELLKQLARSGGYHVAPSWLVDILTASYQAGADQELEACVEWFRQQGYDISVHKDLRAARRPKPPSLAEKALQELVNLKADANSMGMGFDAPAIRRALERLQQLEEQQWTQPLSPAAQAVLEAFNAAPPDHSIHELPPDCGHRALAAALRALADQVVPKRLESRGIRSQILAIATELEGGNG